jgi:hypothetical protein
MRLCRFLGGRTSVGFNCVPTGVECGGSIGSRWKFTVTLMLAPGWADTS